MRWILVALVFLGMGAAGCLSTQSMDDAPGFEAGSARQRPAELYDFAWSGELGQQTHVCGPNGCVASPETRPATNVGSIALRNGTLQRLSLNVTWTAESPLTQTMQAFLGVPPADCAGSCAWTPVAHVQGASPLGLDYVPAGNASHIEHGQAAVLVVASTSNWDAAPFAVLVKAGQAFEVSGRTSEWVLAD